ncbi:MAG: response regulator transcription factor [Lachnospiraceae bacterium]|nr:response regulator transcription factor [Lachnospiraceae bacterium]
MITNVKYCRIGICEDDGQYRNFLVDLIRRNLGDEDNIGIYFFADGKSLLSSKERNELDILFMDVELPDGNGNDFVKEFRQTNTKAILNFCTNVGYPTADTFKLDVYRYIRKDVTEEILERQIIEILEEYRRKRKLKKFYLASEEIAVNISEILYCEKQKRGTKIHLLDQDEGVLVSEHLDNIFIRLEQYGFGRPHDSYIVNFEHIICVNRKKLTLFGGSEMTIAPRKWKNFREAFYQYIVI